LDFHDAYCHAGFKRGGILYQWGDCKAKLWQCGEDEFQAPLTSLVWIASLVSIAHLCDFLDHRA
jgi:hypothetical protein